MSLAGLVCRGWVGRGWVGWVGWESVWGGLGAGCRNFGRRAGGVQLARRGIGIGSAGHHADQGCQLLRERVDLRAQVPQLGLEGRLDFGDLSGYVRGAGGRSGSCGCDFSRVRPPRRMRGLRVELEDSARLFGFGVAGRGRGLARGLVQRVAGRAVQL